VSVVVALVFWPLAGSGSPTSALREYNAGNYTNALQEFSRLALIQTNDLRLVFNAGAAAYRATNFDEALKNFRWVTLSPDLKLQQPAYYNLGNTQFRIGELANDLDGMQSTWETAIKSYERAHELNTNDVDAAYNLAFARNCVAQIVELREAAHRAKEAADENVRRNNYHRALEIMENLLRINPAAKPFQDYTKRLKDIDDIATPHQP
jgi:tetratricopeptide (TPR) repeat protein